MPKVSICIPAYNQTQYLRSALDSIIKQSFDDFEVVVTDDSTDNRVKDLIDTYNFNGKLKYYHNSIPLGPPKNWNFCISKSSGAYIKILHHDDWFSCKDSLSEFVKAMEDSQVSMVCSDAYVWYEKSKRTGLHTPGVENTRKLMDDPSALFLMNYIGGPSRIMYKRDDFIQFDENLKWLVDIDFYIRYLKAHRQITCIEKPLITVLAEGEDTVTSHCQDNAGIEIFENFYLFNKLKKGLYPSQILAYSKFLIGLLKRFDIKTLEDVKRTGYSNDIPVGFKTIYYAGKLKSSGMQQLRKIKKLIFSPFNSSAKSLADIKIRFKRNSYSQSGEDMIVDLIFNHIGISNPSYMDIGAHHPFYLSNTAYFYEKGSRGINIEPDPELFELFNEHRREDRNLNIGIGANEGSADLFIISSPTLNTFSREEAEAYIKEGDYRIVNTINVPINSIKNVIDKYNDGRFPHFLNVDAEGVDELIIKSIDYTQNYPLVICIETVSFSTSGDGVKNTNISQFLLEMGYMIYGDTNINTIFVRTDSWRKQKNDHR